MSHWYSLTFFWIVAPGIGVFIGVALSLFTLLVPWFLSRRTITYELLTSAQLIHLPTRVNPDLQVTYRDSIMEDPHVVVARLIYRGRRDLPSAAFDQEIPINLDIGTEITSLLHTAFTPSKEPVPAIRFDGTKIEIGPSLIRKHLEIEFTILIDGSSVKLDCHGSLADVKFRPQQLEEARRRRLHILRFSSTVLAWLCIVFIAWWIVEQPAGAAHVIHVILSLNLARRLFSWLTLPYGRLLIA